MGAEVMLPVLPKGCTLPHAGGGAGCKLLALEIQGPGANVYRAYDLSPSRRCPVCANQEPGETVICRTCGADLAQVPPGNAVIFLHESADPACLQPGPGIYLSGVRHPHLLLPVYAQRINFADGSSRSYLLMPERPAPVLGDLPAPHAVHTVLRWGIQLAQALAQLHAAGILHGEIDLRHVLARPDRAWLTCDPGETPSAHAPSYGCDVQQLARVLLHALTGSDDPAGLGALPPPVHRALEVGFGAAPQESPPASRFADALASAAAEIDAWARTRSSAAWMTDPGQRRMDNEDSLAVLTLDVNYAGIRTSAGIYVVADGAGGHTAGELASRAAVEAVAGHLAAGLLAKRAAALQPVTDDLTTDVLAAFAEANTAVRRLRTDPNERPLTTLTVLMIVGQHAWVAHAGDTRLYRWDGALLDQVTQDHTLAARLAAEAASSGARPASTVGRNQLLRALGGAEVVEPDLHELDLSPSDVLLLCSDGLHGEITDPEIDDILAQRVDLASSVCALLDAANAAGGRDNITVILVRPCDRSALP